MDLLLTHAYCLAEDPVEQQVMKPYPPLGLLYLSSHLKARGFDVDVFDATFRQPGDLARELDRRRPRVVGFYCNLMTKRQVVRAMQDCRRVGCVVVVGGPDAANYPGEYLDAGAAAVVVGEGERTLEELVPRLSGGQVGSLDDVAGLVLPGPDGTVIRTAPRAQIEDLDAQPLPDRDAVDIRQYLDVWRRHHGRSAMSLVTARGCPYTCSWCSRSVFGGTHRRRSPANVADEVQTLVERYDPGQLWYTDDVFTIHRGWTLKYADEMQRRGLRVPFECISRAERIDDDVADALASLGCFRLWIGSESGSQRVLDAMDRRVTVEQVRQATRRLQDRGIEVGMFIMLGYGDERLDDLRQTVEHLKQTAPDVFLTTVAYPIRGTRYYEEVEHDIVSAGEWATRTDRDLRIRGRHSPAYYQHVRRWLTHEVSRDRLWRDGRYLRACGAAAKAGAARLGMAATARQREA